MKLIKYITALAIGVVMAMPMTIKYNALAYEENVIKEYNPYLYIGEQKSEYIRINEETFPDETLRNYIDSEYGETSEDGERIAWVTGITAIDTIGDGINTYGYTDNNYNYSDDKNLIKSLKGVEYLTNLSWLNVRLDGSPDINFENNKKLYWVTIIGNNVGNLDFSKNTELETLYVFSDSASVSLGDNPKLIRLMIDAPIESVDLSGCTGLISLGLEHADITDIDLSRCNSLMSLEIERSNISSLDVSGCKNLILLNASYNDKLSELKLNNSLEKLWLHDSKVSELDVSTCPSLCFADIAFNPVTSLNVNGTELFDGSVIIDNSQTVLSKMELRHVTVLVRGEKSGTINMDNIPAFDHAYLGLESNILSYDFGTVSDFYNSENGQGGGMVIMNTTSLDGSTEGLYSFSDVYKSYGDLTYINMFEKISFWENDEITTWVDPEFHYIRIVYDNSYDTIIHKGEKYSIRNNMEGQFWAEPVSEYFYSNWFYVDTPSLGYCPIGDIYLEQLSGDYENGAPKAFLLKKNNSGSFDMNEIAFDIISEENGFIEYDYSNPHYMYRGYLPSEKIDGYIKSFEQYNINTQDKIGKKYSNYQGYDFYIDDAGNTRCYDGTGKPVINEFKCDGTYTYYFQADGTAMKDRLTYHPDGVHVIYFDSEGHEVFSDFANVRKTIAGDEVNDFCFFDVFGYMYVDVLTYDKTGSVLYYANPYGVMEMGKWFQFSDTVEWADGTPAEGIAGGYGYANADGTLMTNTQTIDWEGRSCYLQGNGVAFY